MIKPTKQTVDQVKAVTSKYNIVEDSSKRKLKFVYKRHLISWYLDRNTFFSKSKIAELIGKKDHATVSSGIKTAQQLIDSKDEKFYEYTKDVQKDLDICLTPKYKRKEDKQKEVLKRVLEIRNMDDVDRLKSFVRNNFEL